MPNTDYLNTDATGLSDISTFPSSVQSFTEVVNAGTLTQTGAVTLSGAVTVNNSLTMGSGDTINATAGALRIPSADTDTIALAATGMISLMSYSVASAMLVIQDPDGVEHIFISTLTA